MTLPRWKHRPTYSIAKVFVSSIGGQEEEVKVLEALNSAAGFLRTELAKNVRMRRVPELHFIWDSSIEHGDQILRLLDQVNAEQEKL